jgi:hypothetical protein
MKKIIFCLVIALAITGAVSAQTTPTGMRGDAITTSAVPTISTESRYSAGRFGSYIDDFIGVNDYNPGIGTFFFLGGYPQDSPNYVDATDVLYDNNYELSIGIGKSLKNNMYLGFYFGGNLFYASGTDNGKDDATKATTSSATWNSKIAILLGTPSLGGLRLDLILDATDTTITLNDKNVNGTVGGGTVTALSWGKNIKALSPHVTLAARWPDYSLNVIPAGDIKRYSNGAIVVSAGSGYDLNDTSSLSADITIQGNFGMSQKGPSPNDASSKGPFWTWIDFSYSKDFVLNEKFAFGLSPYALIGLRVYDTTTKSGGTEFKGPTETTFQLFAGIDVGAEYKLTRKYSLYTGLSLNLFDWVALGFSGGDPKTGGGAWKIDGFKFDTDKWAGQDSLGFGLVYAPNSHLSVGAGLNAILDQFFIIDLARMQARGGTLWSGLTSNSTATGAMGTFFTNLTIDLTVSYTF